MTKTVEDIDDYDRQILSKSFLIFHQYILDIEKRKDLLIIDNKLYGNRFFI